MMTERLSYEQIESLRESWRLGHSWGKAAALAEVSLMTVARYFREFKEFDVPRGERAPAPIDIPPEVLADRDRRLSLAPRSLVARVCGDPLPGYSALERRS